MYQKGPKILKQNVNLSEETDSNGNIFFGCHVAEQNNKTRTILFSGNMQDDLDKIVHENVRKKCNELLRREPIGDDLKVGPVLNFWWVSRKSFRLISWEKFSNLKQIIEQKAVYPCVQFELDFNLENPLCNYT